MSETIHLAIYKTDDYSLLIEYELIGDAIEIQSVDFQARPISDFEQRNKIRQSWRGVVFIDQDAIPEMMQLLKG